MMGTMLCSWSLMAALAIMPWPEDLGPNSSAWEKPIGELNRDWTKASPHDRIRMRLEGQLPPECTEEKKMADSCC